MHPSMGERPVPAPLSERAALLSTLRTGGVPCPQQPSDPQLNRLSVPSYPVSSLEEQAGALHLGQPRRPTDDGHQHTLHRIKSAQLQAAARHSQPPPVSSTSQASEQEILARQLAAHQQLQQAELLRLLALQRQQQQQQQQQLIADQQQQQLLLLQALQAQAAQQQQALQAASGLDAPPTAFDELIGSAPQRHSWNPESNPSRRAVSGRFSTQVPPRPASTLSVPQPKPRATSSADMASSWRAPGGPHIVVDDEDSSRSLASTSTSLTAPVGEAGETSALEKPVARTRVLKPERESVLLLQPVRQPQGPPTDPAELEAGNFMVRKNTKTRKDAIKLLATGRHAEVH